MGSYDRLSFIDTWRTIAVGFVILAHFSWNQEIKTIYDSSPLLHYFSVHGETGVFIFFFISGYVVSRSCLAELAATGDFSIVGFYIRRVFRIVPPLLIYLIACLMLGCIGMISFTSAEFVAASFYFCNNSLVNCGWAAAHTWSLAFEEQFYLMFPMAFGFYYLRNSPPLLAILIVTLVALVPLVWPINYIGRTGFVVTYSLFGAGYLLACKPGLFPKKQSVVNMLFLVATAVTFLPLEYFLGTLHFAVSVDARLALAKYYKFILMASIPVMVMSTGVLASALNRIFSWRGSAYLGRASYSVYLWQQLAAGAWPHVSAVMQLVAICLMVSACIILYEFAEKRLIRLGRKLATSASQKC